MKILNTLKNKIITTKKEKENIKEIDYLLKDIIEKEKETRHMFNHVIKMDRTIKGVKIA